MAKKKVQFDSPEDVEKVFYEAFRHCDERVMAALWAEKQVICVHPGSAPITSYVAICRSWRHIFANTKHANIRYQIAKKTVSGAVAVHVVIEEILHGNEVIAEVVATNVYEKFAEGWLMTEHHASLLPSQRNQQTIQ